MINKVTLIGNLGNAPELKTTESGVSVARMSVATNESYKDKNGEWQTQTQWHNVIVWRELADRTAKLQKGDTVYVEGKITYREYTDKEGVKRSSTDIVAETVRSLTKHNAEQKPQQQSEQRQNVPVHEPVSSDDLPF